MDTPVTALGVVFQLIASGLLTYLIPRNILKKHGMQVTVVFSFFAIFSANFVSGVIFSLIVTLILSALFWWVTFIGEEDAGTKRILFIVTFVLVSLYLPCSIATLPIRLADHQVEAVIAGYAADTFMALAMLSSLVEWLILKRNRKRRREEVEIMLANLQAD